jgi:hypothetical protein
MAALIAGIQNGIVARTADTIVICRLRQSIAMRMDIAANVAMTACNLMMVRRW